MSFISKILTAIGNLGSASTVGCIYLWIDEAEMPASLIEK